MKLINNLNYAVIALYNEEDYEWDVYCFKDKSKFLSFTRTTSLPPQLITDLTEFWDERDSFQARANTLLLVLAYLQCDENGDLDEPLQHNQCIISGAGGLLVVTIEEEEREHA